jgi:hypothetical protein
MPHRNVLNISKRAHAVIEDIVPGVNNPIA